MHMDPPHPPLGSDGGGGGRQTSRGGGSVASGGSFGTVADIPRRSWRHRPADEPRGGEFRPSPRDADGGGSNLFPLFGDPGNFVTVGANPMDPNSDPIDYEAMGFGVFGAIYTPRIYAQDLSVLELASTGAVAFTTGDRHTLSLNRSPTESNVTVLETVPNESLVVSAGEGTAGGSNASLRLDAGDGRRAELRADQSALRLDPTSAGLASSGDVTLASSAAALIGRASTEIDLSVGDASGVRVRDADVALRSGSTLSVTAAQQVLLGVGTDAEDGGAAAGAELSLNADDTLRARAGAASLKLQDDRCEFGFDDIGVMRVMRDKVVINTQLDVRGVVNSVSITETQLEVQDKSIRLAHAPEEGGGAASTTVDGPANSGAGITVSGLPEGVQASAEAERRYAKGVSWNYGTTGVDGLLTSSGMDGEAFWEIRGGSMRLSAVKADGTKIAYGFRINHQDELEIVKRWVDGGNAFAARVAKFGRLETSS